MTHKHIYIYSPSGAVRDRLAFKRGVRRLKALGHEVEIDSCALSRHQRFAGTDEARVQAVARAAASGADVALLSRGGYGLTRILPQLPYEALAQSIKNGTQWVGLSDFTALQLGLMAHQQHTHGAFGAGAVTWAGPALGEDFGVDPSLATDEQPLPDDIMESCFEDLLTGLGEGTGWRVPRRDVVATKAAAADPEAPINIAQAVLWGGNLAVLSSMVGTPWLPKVPGGILFLEDVGEHPYRIERMLTQLLYAGVLHQQRAVLLGQFTQYKPVPHDRGFTLRTVTDWLRHQLAAPTDLNPHGVPVLTDLPFGHVPTKVLLPVGKPVDLHLMGSEALMFWD